MTQGQGRRKGHGASVFGGLIVLVVPEGETDYRARARLITMRWISEVPSKIV